MSRDKKERITGPKRRPPAKAAAIEKMAAEEPTEQDLINMVQEFMEEITSRMDFFSIELEARRVATTAMDV